LINTLQARSSSLLLIECEEIPWSLKTNCHMMECLLMPKFKAFVVTRACVLLCLQGDTAELREYSSDKL
jgi:hypothetical protein